MGELAAGCVIISFSGQKYLITGSLGMFVGAIDLSRMVMTHVAESYHKLGYDLGLSVGVTEVIPPKRVHIEIDDPTKFGD